MKPDRKQTANTREVDEHLRRQTKTAQEFRLFRDLLAQRFDNAPFMIVRVGDHQPALSHRVLEPDKPALAVAARVMAHDPKYYETYYAIDTIRFRPVDLPPLADRIDASYLPVIIQRAAGVPLDKAFAEQNRIMESCRGVFYDCRDGAEARRFNRLLMDSGRITGM